VKNFTIKIIIYGCALAGRAWIWNYYWEGRQPYPKNKPNRLKMHCAVLLFLWRLVAQARVRPHKDFGEKQKYIIWIF